MRGALRSSGQFFGARWSFLDGNGLDVAEHRVVRRDAVSVRPQPQLGGGRVVRQVALADRRVGVHAVHQVVEPLGRAGHVDVLALEVGLVEVHVARAEPLLERQRAGLVHAAVVRREERGRACRSRSCCRARSACRRRRGAARSGRSPCSASAGGPPRSRTRAVRSRAGRSRCRRSCGSPGRRPWAPRCSSAGALMISGPTPGPALGSVRDARVEGEEVPDRRARHRRDAQLRGSELIEVGKQRRRGGARGLRGQSEDRRRHCRPAYRVRCHPGPLIPICRAKDAGSGPVWP